MNFCFKYCVLCKFFEVYKKDHPCRICKYKPFENDSIIKWDGVNFPASNEDIDYFEEINNRTISVNVYKVDNEKIRIDRTTKITEPICHVNLLRLDDDEGSHYVLIKDYSRLLGGQTNKKNK